MTRRADIHARTGNRGFTLIELSVVLFIIAVVVGMSVDMGISVIATARLSATQQKMKTIDSALMQYRTATDRLPCPGNLTLAPGSADYGLEAGVDAGSSIAPGTGVCTGTGMLPVANYTAAGATNTGATGAEGALPAVTLGLSPDFMLDGWGNKFRYAVDIAFTAKGVFASNAVSCTPTGAITVNDVNTNARSKGSVYALISHGANGHGAYTPSGSTVDAGSVNANEQTNCHCTSAGAYNGSYAPTYVQMQPTQDSGNPLDNFDDLVSYRERWQMRTDWDAVSCAQYIYIADSNNNRIREVTAATGIITTVAGNGTGSYSGDGGAATSAELGSPSGVAVDSSGNLYIADTVSNRIRKVTASTGIITTVAGNGTQGYNSDGIAATSAELGSPSGVAVDSSGNLYIGDFANNRIRKVTVATGIITTVAGNGTGGYNSDGGAATSAELNGPSGVAVNSSGNIYIADSANNRIRKVTVATGIITTVAGNGTGGYNSDGIAATSAELNGPYGVAVDSSGNLYIAETQNNRVRKVSASTGIITTVAGNGTGSYSGDGGAATSAELNFPAGVAVDSRGNLYIADDSNSRIRKVTASTGIITTVAGNGTQGYNSDGIAATSAEFYWPVGVAVGSR